MDGDIIKCANCGRLNDLTSIKELAVSKKKSEIAEEFTKEIKKNLKNSFKKFK